MNEIVESNAIVKKKEQEVLLPNPFPGLRAFGIDESHLFFGREGQSDEVLLKLSNHKFVAVIGSSGSGKSSFMFCGVIPILFGGFLTDIGTGWDVVVSRPGSSPIENLTQSLLKMDQDYLSAEDEEKKLRKTITSTLLKSSSLGLVEAVDQIWRRKKNVLILIDQFEELFRFKKSEESTGLPNETLAFVNLLIETSQYKESPIYIGITMRSDFIGECAQFPGLTKLINDSNYLIPQMAREQKRLAIIGPVAVGGGTVAPRLVQQLLNDLGDNTDQLPIMQHALMRTWSYWLDHKEKGESIDLEHYEAIGKMEGALSQHANEAYEELDTRQKQICESMFKALTEKSSESQGIRRPTKLSIIAELASCTEDEVKVVIEKFRQQGRSLLSPSYGISLNSNSSIDISHESLMRIWVRLKIWVDEEGEAVEMYLRLCEAAEKYQKGKSGLWRPPDLQLAINWKEKHNPTLTWAQRYNPAYERTIVFLDTSITEYETEQKVKEFLQKQQLKRAKIFAIILGTAAIISIGFLIFAIIAQQKAEKLTIVALQNEKEALKQKKLADIQREEAVKQKQLAELQRLEAIKQQEIAEAQTKIAEVQTKEANIQKGIALDKERIANEQTKLAIQEREKAVLSEKEANIQKEKAEKSEKDAYKRRLLSIAQSMAVKSLQVGDTTRKGLVAYQAYLFNKNNGGSPTNHDVYNALYYALKTLKPEDYNALRGHKDAVRSVIVNKDGKKMYSAGSDGKILEWDLDGKSKTPKMLIDNPFTNRILALSPDGKWLAAGGETNDIQLFGLSQTQAEPKILKGHKGPVSSMSFLKDNSGFISTGSDSLIAKWNVNSDVFTKLVKSNSKIKTIALSSNGNNIAGINSKGQIVIWDVKNEYQERILVEKSAKINHSIAFSNDSRLLAFGNEVGKVRIWNLADRKVEFVLTGQKARINELKFNRQNTMLASASFDGSIHLWNLENLNEQPIELKDHSSWVWSLDFTPSGDKVIAGCVDNLIRIWPSNMDEMADQMCEKLNRNMSNKEWEQFVATDISYEKTCGNKPKGEDKQEE